MIKEIDDTRKSKGLGYIPISYLTKLSPATIQGIFMKGTKTSFNNIVKLCAALDIDIIELIEKHYKK